MAQTPEQRRAYYQANKDKWKVYNSVAYATRKEELLEYQRQYRKNNKNKIKEAVAKKRQKKLDRLIGMLGGCCADCGVSYPSAVYDFHHLNPSDKGFTIGENMHKRLTELESEAQKCVLLCANCHRIRHITETGTDETL